MNHDDRRRAQIAALSDAGRLQVLDLILSTPEQTVSIEHLSGAGMNKAAVVGHVEALIEVGLVIRDEDSAEECFRPSADAIARFGGAWLGDRRHGAGSELGEHRGLLHRISADLTARFADHLAPETVEQFVDSSYRLLASRASVRTHLPTLTERFATERLTALVDAADLGRNHRKDVLFVCVRNAGRSQIAAALMRSIAGDRVRIRTAGSRPAHSMDPAVQAELGRLGVAKYSEFPRPLTSEVLRASGVVVTMGCGDACPVLPGRRYVDWPVRDPIGRPAPEVRVIIADIAARVEALVLELQLGSDTG